MTPHEMIPPVRAGRNGLATALRWIGLVALGVAGGLLAAALLVIATAAALIGAIVGAVVILALRLNAPSRRRRDGALVLEGRRTADGWVVEAARPGR
jgi:membrane associated rhomboid family serine protease